jgi:proline iminopeptidase
MKKSFNGLLGILLGFIGVLGTLFLLMFILSSGDYPVPETVANDPTLPHVTINGAVFHAETFGDPSNPVVIVVHGGPGWDYRSLLPLKSLADAFYVVFYDQRGTGLSPRVQPEALNLETSIEDLDLIVDYFAKGKKPSLIGHSWGAMLVSAYLGKHPDKLSHVVLAEPGFLTTEMAKEAHISFGPKLEPGFLLRAAHVWFQSLHIKSPDGNAASDYFLGRVAPYANTEYYCGGVVPEAGTELWRAGAVAMQNVLKSAVDSEGNLDINLIDGVDKHRDEVLFIASECNTKIGAAFQRKQMMFFPNAELVVIQGSGHMMFGEKPAASVSAVRTYLMK